MYKIILVILLLVISIINPALSALLISWFLIARMLQQSFTNFIDTRFTLYLYSFIVLSILSQFSVLTVWLLDNEFPLDKLNFFTLIVVLLCFLIYRRRDHYTKLAQNSLKGLKIINLANIVGILVACLAVLMVIVGPAKRSLDSFDNFNFKSIAIDLLNTSLDDSSHLSRFNDRVELNRGVLLGIEQENLVVHKNSVGTYPPGFHSFNVALVQSFIELKAGSMAVYSYVFTKILWLFMFVYLFAYSAIKLFQSSTTKFKVRKNALELAAVSFVAVFFTYYALMEQFKEGFYNFMPVLAYLVLIFNLALHYRKGSESNPAYLAFMYILILGVSLSWILVLPGLVLSFLMILADQINIKKLGLSLKRVIIELWKHTSTYLPVYTFGAVALLTQVYLLRSDSARTFSEGVNDPGAITQHPASYYYFISIGLVLFFYYCFRNMRLAKFHLTPILSILTGLLLSGLFIFVFQQLTAGHTEYYFTKTMNTFYIPSLFVAICGYVLIARSLIKSTSYGEKVLIYLLLIIGLPLMLGLEPVNTSNLGYVKGYREFTPQENVILFNNIVESTSTPIKQRSADTFFYKAGNYGYTVVANNILRSTQPVGECEEAIFSDLARSDEYKLTESLRGCLSTNEITIYTDKDSVLRIPQQDTELYNIEFITLN